MNLTELTAMLRDINFWVPALSAMILALATSLVGSVSVLRGQSLIGDAIGHASLPGVMLAFMLFLTRAPWVLMLGAMVFGYIAYRLIEYLAGPDKADLDRAQAIVLSSFFGLGITLKSVIQSHPHYRQVPKAGLETYIFGQAALAARKDLYMIIGVAIFTIILFFIFYKEIQLSIFDDRFADVTGFKPDLVHQITLILILALIATGLRVVGAILIAALLIAPTVAGLQWKGSFRGVLRVAAVTGVVSAFLGTLLGRLGWPNGASIVFVLSLITLVSIVIGTHSTLRKKRMSRRL
ncbi:MAG: metal ABC transporter permease [Eubacteriales bacterium]|nr:metal ABC transporter permease [Eubacteriales bacterium]